MKFIADFHLHSHFSMATSKNCTPEHLEYWASLKGIDLIGTGDFTHPGWLKELRDKLEPAEPGFFKLKKKIKRKSFQGNNLFADKKVRFILTSEISSIYKKKGKVRKVHNCIFAPDFESVEKIQHLLQRTGANITSDGRPIIGLDSRNLLELALQASENIFFVPAHIWTPWFSVLGSQSGFNSITDCFEDLSPYIYAVETGLSSDPAMNRLCSFLDPYALISNSDAHSPEKLGREANIFDTELSYAGVIKAMKTNDPSLFCGTLEFFPQEGKYHYDGHRKCNINWDPAETLRHSALCPICNKRVTIGVLNRVIQLSDRNPTISGFTQQPFYPLIPLKAILAEMLQVGPNSKKIESIYLDLLNHYGSELHILVNLSLKKLYNSKHRHLAEGIQRMRKGEVSIQEGADGQYGKISVFL